MLRYFFDTNILVYSIDKADPVKQALAQNLIINHSRARNGIISTQVIQEFYVAATRKLKVDPHAAKQHIRDFHVFEIVQVTSDLIESGIDSSVLNQLSFWDGLIISSAQLARCNTLYSEDMNDGQAFDGVTLLNPFNR